MTTILVKDAALTTWLSGVVEHYRGRFPADYEKFSAHVSQERKQLIKKSGMSKEGHFMNRLYIPTKLYLYLKELAYIELGIDDFFRDRANYDLLCRVCSDLKTSRPDKGRFLDLGATNAV